MNQVLRALMFATMWITCAIVGIKVLNVVAVTPSIQAGSAGLMVVLIIAAVIVSITVLDDFSK